MWPPRNVYFKENTVPIYEETRTVICQFSTGTSLWEWGLNPTFFPHVVSKIPTANPIRLTQTWVFLINQSQPRSPSQRLGPPTVNCTSRTNTLNTCVGSNYKHTVTCVGMRGGRQAGTPDPVKLVQVSLIKCHNFRTQLSRAAHEGLLYRWARVHTHVSTQLSSQLSYLT